MNELIVKKNFLIIIKNSFKKYYKIIIGFILFLTIIIAFSQIFFLYQNNKILKTSIEYNNAKSNNLDTDFYKKIEKLSYEKNFFGILARLEKILVNLNNNNINLAYEDYLFLLNKKKLNSTYKTAIAIHGSYSLLNKLNYFDETNLSNKNVLKDIPSMIQNLLLFTDSSLESYQGFKLEILYLLTIIDLDRKSDSNIYDKSKNLYKQIQDNDNASSALKERVKAIHEFQKYK